MKKCQWINTLQINYVIAVTDIKPYYQRKSIQQETNKSTDNQQPKYIKKHNCLFSFITLQWQRK